jgi:hypothetical protein
VSWISCVWAWVAGHAIILSTVVSAIAAAVIAWFTIVLAGATRGLKASADKQIAIAETQAAISGAQTDVLRAKTNRSQATYCYSSTKIASTPRNDRHR